MTARLPFNPASTRAAKAAASDPRPAPGIAESGADAPLSVSQLSASIERVIASGLPGRVVVRGEIGQARQRTHWYFSLKDDSAVLECVLWASAAKRLAMPLRTGDSVVVRGRVEFYKPQGRITLIAESVDPAGQGDLHRRLRELIDEVRGLGWLAPERKRPLPVFPRRIAVITSRTGAALQDVIDTARRRCPAVDLLTVDALVQGERAPNDVAQAIRFVNANRARLGVEAILLTRGGGSIEDLWAFNERVVAEAVVNSELPVVAAIGHESDTTLAELVADERAATPTQAAMRLTPDRDDLSRQIDTLGRRLRQATLRGVEHRAHRLAVAANHRALADPGFPVQLCADRLERARSRAHNGLLRALTSASRRLQSTSDRLERVRPERVLRDRLVRLERAAYRLSSVASDAVEQRDTVDRLATRLERAARRAAEHRRARVESAREQLELVGPIAVLRRGYSVTTDADGNLIRSIEDVEPGDRIHTRLADGGLDSIIETAATQGTQPSPAALSTEDARPSHDPVPPGATRPDRKKPAPSRDQLDLF